MSFTNKRWLLLTQYFPPEIGAPQIRLRAVSQALKEHGIQVEVLTAMPNYPAGKIFSGYEGRWCMREEVSGIPIRRTWVYAGTGKSAHIRLANYFSFTVTALFAALFGPRPDLLFLESQPLSLGIVGLLMKWLRGVPYIYNVPDLQIDVAQQLGFMNNTFFLRVAFGLENLFMRHSLSVSTVTHRFIEHFQERNIPRKQISFLPNGADTDFLLPQSPSQELLERWHLAGKKIFAYIGTHAFYHGLDTLLEAAAMLQANTNIVFLFIGDGPERERLKKLATTRKLTNVVFGQSPYEEMDKLYSITYVAIATLRNMEVAKTMRLSKIFPALSCGVPVIYAGFGEAAELLVQHKCGIAVPPENAAELAQAILALAQDPEHRQLLGETGRKLVEREYSWSVIVARWLEEISENTNP